MLASIARNRDGTVAYGGCTFCSAAGSGDFAGDRRDDVITQYHEMKEKCAQSGKMEIAYFQAYTNTHAPLEVLKEKFEPLLAEKTLSVFLSQLVQIVYQTMSLHI